MESLFRTRNLQSDITTNFAAIPMQNNSLAHTNEQRFTARQSRAALLIEGNITDRVLASGYYEADFNSTGSASNQNQTNSYNLRMRNIYANIDWLDTGFHFLAGQNWTLAMQNSRGITPRNEVGPPTIDNGFMPGIIYARQPQIRLTKDFFDKRLWVAISAEQSSTTFANGCNAVVNNTGSAITATSIPGNGVANVTCLAPGVGGYGGSGLNQQLSINHVPDVIAKVVYGGQIGPRDYHLEVFGLYKNFYDRVNYGTFVAATGYTGPSINQDVNGYGVGAGLLFPILPRRLDLDMRGMYGRGIMRYGSASLNDATIDGNGSVKPIPAFAAVTGLTLHASRALDVYTYAGIEGQSRAYSSNGAGGLVGYGLPNANDTGCYIEGAASSTCAGNTQRVWQITGGFWDKIYEGRFGYFRAGVQYSYTRRDLFSSTAGPGGRPIQPGAGDNILITSLRYYPF